MTTIFTRTHLDTADRQSHRAALRRIRAAEAARRVPDGTLIILGVPPGFPPFFAAAMHLPSAKRLNKAKVRIDSGGRSWERSVHWIEREARRLWLGGRFADTISLSRSSEPQRSYVQGTVFSAGKGA